MSITIQSSRPSITIEPLTKVVVINTRGGLKGDTGIGIPAGGTTGQLAAKKSDDDFDLEWKNPGSFSGDTDDVGEGSTNLYFTSVRALSAAPAENAVSVGALINNSAALDTLDDAAKIGFWDNVANTLKHITVANLIIFLKTIFAALTDSKVNEDRTTLTAVSGGTTYLNLSLGRSFSISTADLTSGQSFTIAFQNVPAGVARPELTLLLANPTAFTNFNITWPTGITAVALQANKTGYFTIVIDNNDPVSARMFLAGWV